MFPLKRSHPVISVVSNSLVDLPSPSSISSFWNFGSLLGLCLGVQLITGIFLAAHYSCDTQIAFSSVNHIMRDVNRGWTLRAMHANGASLFFLCIYLHIARGIYYGGYKLVLTWSVGVTILLLVMATAFLGYVLPWGQISFWGATVITNLFRAIPWLGRDIVTWLWGGFSVGNATLTRFFSFHFLLPFLLMAIVGIHLVFLHETGSSSKLGLVSNVDKVPFHPYFSVKDLLGVWLTLFVFMYLTTLNPWILGDPENFIPANPIVTPLHIQPEWYFLFAYAILRSIPNKLGGVVALGVSVLLFYAFPLIPQTKFSSLSLYPANSFLFFCFISVVLLLTWVGARPVEAPYVGVGQTLTILYFIYPVIDLVIKKLWDSILR